MEHIRENLPLTFLFERQLSGLLQWRAKQTLTHLVQKWLHGFLGEGMRRWIAHFEACRLAERSQAALRIQSLWRGHIARTYFDRLWEADQIMKEEERFRQLMETRMRWLSATAIQSVFRGYSDRIGPIEIARTRWKACVRIQGWYRVLKAQVLRLIMAVRAMRRDAAARTIQRIVRGGAGRRRARHRAKVWRMEQRELILADRDFVIAHGSQNWCCHCHTEMVPSSHRRMGTPPISWA